MNKSRILPCQTAVPGSGFPCHGHISRFEVLAKCQFHISAFAAMFLDMVVKERKMFCKNVRYNLSYNVTSN